MPEGEDGKDIPRNEQELSLLDAAIALSNKIHEDTNDIIDLELDQLDRAIWRELSVHNSQADGVFDVSN